MDVNRVGHEVVQQRDTQRAADVLRNIQKTAGHRQLVAGNGVERRGHQGRHHQRQTGAAGYLRQDQQGPAGHRIQPAELDQRTSDQDASQAGQERRAVTIRQPSGQRHGQAHCHGIGKHPQAGVNGGVAHQVLKENGKQKDAAEQPDGTKDGQQDAQKIIPDEKKPQIEQGMFDGQFDRDEHHQADDADSLADMNIVGLPPFLLPVGQGGQAGDKSHGQERKAEHIEGPFGPVRAKRPHDDHAGQQGDHPEGQVDGKDRSPAEGIGQIAAQGRAQRGSGHDAGAPDAQRPPAFVRFKQFRHDGHADRLDGAASQGLKDAGGDQRFIAPRHGTEGAGRREDQQASQVKGLVADPAGEPADQRHDDRRGQHESRRDPLDLLTVDPEGAHHVR